MSKISYEEFYDQDMETEVQFDRERTSNDPILKMRSYLDSKPGYVLLTTMLFLTCGWATLVKWSQNEENYWQAQKISGIISFFLFATITPWAMMMFLLTVMALRRKKKLNVWFCIFGYFSLVWAVIVVLASAVLYYNATLVLCQRYRCNVLKYVAASFGMVSGISLGLQAYLHLRVLKQSCCFKRNRPYETVTNEEVA